MPPSVLPRFLYIRHPKPAFTVDLMSSASATESGIGKLIGTYWFDSARSNRQVPVSVASVGRVSDGAGFACFAVQAR